MIMVSKMPLTIPSSAAIAAANRAMAKPCVVVPPSTAATVQAPTPPPFSSSTETSSLMSPSVKRETQAAMKARRSKGRHQLSSWLPEIGSKRLKTADTTANHRSV